MGMKGIDIYAKIILDAVRKQRIATKITNAANDNAPFAGYALAA